MHGSGARGSILNLGPNLPNCLQQNLPKGHLRSQGLRQSLWEPEKRVISVWCVEGTWAASLEVTLGG